MIQDKIGAYLGVEVQPDGIQSSSGIVALQVGGCLELLDKRIGDLSALVSVTRGNTMTCKSLVNVVFVVEVDTKRQPKKSAIR